MKKSYLVLTSNGSKSFKFKKYAEQYRTLIKERLDLQSKLIEQVWFEGYIWSETVCI